MKKIFIASFLAGSFLLAFATSAVAQFSYGDCRKHCETTYEAATEPADMRVCMEGCTYGLNGSYMGQTLCQTRNDDQRLIDICQKAIQAQ